MVFANLIEGMDTAVNRFWLMGRSDSETDETFYDAARLTDEERNQADAATAAQTTPEGSILLVEPGTKTHGFRGFTCTDPSLRGEARAKNVVDLFERYLGSNPKNVARTVVVPGCGSSPVGAAALGKTVAEAIGRPVAAIVAGNGAVDKWCEALSGGMLMGPAANMLSAFGRPLEFLVRMNPFVLHWAKACARELTDAIPEAATLFELLRRRLVDETSDRMVLSDAAEWKFDMIVSHSKGNWAVHAALLQFELDVAERIEPPVAVGGHIDVVTFGAWVDLPDQNRLVRDLFHYHRYLGSHDPLALLNSSSWALARLVFARQFDAIRAAAPSGNPQEPFLVGCGHNPVESNDNHMPIERLPPEIRIVK
jgi:hypothetical protein